MKLRPLLRWLRPTVAGLMIVILVIAGILGWIVHRARVQRLAVAKIGSRGVVLYDWQYANDKRITNGTPKGPKWLRRALGPDVFDTVVLVGLSGDTLDDDVMEAVGKLTGLQCMNIQARVPAPVTAAGLSRFRNLTRLERLIIQGGWDTSGLLPHLGDLSRLRILWLPGASPTDADMAMLGRLTNLEELRVKGPKITDAGFAHLTGLSKLRDLAITECDINDLSAMKGKTALQRLHLSNSRAKKLGEKVMDLAPLEGMTKLTSLILPGAIDDAGLKRVAGLPNVTGLVVGGRKITDAGLASLASMPSLEILDLRQISARDLRALGPSLKQLGQLAIDDAPITDEDLAELEELPQLNRLGLSRTLVTDQGMKHLMHLGALRTLDLGRTQVGDEGLAKIAGLRSIELLALYETRTTDAGLKHLAAMTKLRSLVLQGTQITDAGVPDLAKLKSCPAMNLSRTKMTPEGLKRLKKLLPKTSLISVYRDAP